MRALSNPRQTKTERLLNIFYSFMVGVFSSFLTKRYTKAHSLLGVVLAMASYNLSRRISEEAKR
jgi:uncharacterized membrane protein YoaK (UPF0700 family)